MTKPPRPSELRLPPAPNLPPLDLPTPPPIPTRKSPRSDPTYSYYSPAPSSIEMHNDKRPRVERWVNGLPGTLTTGGAGSARWSKTEGVGSGGSSETLPSVLPEKENALRNPVAPPEENGDIVKKKSTNTLSNGHANPVQSSQNLKPTVGNLSRVPSQTLQVPTTHQHNTSPTKAYPAAASRPSSNLHPNPNPIPAQASLTSSTHSQREAYLTSALSLPLDLISEVQDPTTPAPTPVPPKPSRVASLLGRGKLRSKESGGRIVSVASGSVSKGVNGLVGSVLRSRQDSGGGRVEGTRLMRSVTAGPVLEHRQASGRVLSGTHHPTNTDLPNGVSVGSVIESSHQGRISKPTTTTTIAQAVQKPLPSSVLTQSRASETTVRLQGGTDGDNIIQPAPPTTHSHPRSTETPSRPIGDHTASTSRPDIASSDATIVQAALKPLPPTTYSHPRTAETPSRSRLDATTDKSQLRSDRTPSDATLVQASRLPLPSTQHSQQHPSDRRLSSGSIRKPAASPDPSPSIQSQAPTASQSAKNLPLPPTTHAPLERSNTIPSAQPKPAPTHRQMIPLPRPALTPQGSVDGISRTLRRAQAGKGELQTRFEPAMYPLPSSGRTQTTEASSPVPRSSVTSVSQVASPQRSPQTLENRLLSPLTFRGPINDLHAEDDHVSFEVPSGHRGRLRVSLAWLRDGTRNRTRSNDGTPQNQPPPLPPKSDADLQRTDPRKRDTSPPRAGIKDVQETPRHPNEPASKDGYKRYDGSPQMNEFYGPYRNTPFPIQQVYQLQNPYSYPQPIPRSPLPGMIPSWNVGPQPHPGYQRRSTPPSPPRSTQRDSIDPPSEDEPPRPPPLQRSLYPFPAPPLQSTQANAINPYTGRPIGSTFPRERANDILPFPREQINEKKSWKRFFIPHNRQKEERGYPIGSVGAWRDEVPIGRAPTVVHNLPPRSPTAIGRQGYPGPYRSGRQRGPMFTKFLQRRRDRSPPPLTPHQGEPSRHRRNSPFWRRDTSRYPAQPGVNQGDRLAKEEARKVREAEKERWRLERAAKRDSRRQKAEHRQRQRGGIGTGNAPRPTPRVGGETWQNQTQNQNELRRVGTGQSWNRGGRDFGGRNNRGLGRGRSMGAVRDWVGRLKSTSRPDRAPTIRTYPTRHSQSGQTTSHPAPAHTNTNTRQKNNQKWKDRLLPPSNSVSRSGSGSGSTSKRRNGDSGLNTAERGMRNVGNEGGGREAGGGRGWALLFSQFWGVDGWGGRR